VPTPLKFTPEGKKYREVKTAFQGRLGSTDSKVEAESEQLKFG
jgi:hypothetical protein